MGDAYILVVTGLLLGFGKNISLLLIALFLSAIVSAVLLLFKRVHKKTRIPFVPFLAASYSLQVLLG